MAGQDAVKTAARTLDLLEAFAKARGPLSLTEIAQRINTPISSCHSLVRTLQARGYVYVLDSRKRVYPTKRLLAVAGAIALGEYLEAGTVAFLFALALAKNRACLQCLFACALNQYGPGVKLSLRCFLAYKIC